MKNGHESISTGQLHSRPHVDPVPEFIVKQVLRHLNMTREQFFEKL